MLPPEKIAALIALLGRDLAAEVLAAAAEDAAARGDNAGWSTLITQGGRLKTTRRPTWPRPWPLASIVERELRRPRR